MDAIPVPLHKFSYVHVDLVGPWPQTAEGHTSLLTVVTRGLSSQKACGSACAKLWAASMCKLLCLPPPVNWHGGEISLAAEGRATC